jgi:FlaA1/EpsC-like NDP-sugar epimerase
MIQNLIGLLRSRPLIYLHDLAWVPASIYISYFLRFSPDSIPVDLRVGMYWMMAVTASVFAVAFGFLGLYRGVWRFISFWDLIRLIKAVAIGTLTSTLAMFVLERLNLMPRSVLLMFPIVLVLGLIGPRVLYRWLRELGVGPNGPARKRAMIVGAGPLAELLVRRLQRDRVFEATAIVDPDPRMMGKEIHGVRVIGTLRDASAILASNRIDAIILAAPAANAGELSELVTACAQQGILCRTVPQRVNAADGGIEDIALHPITIEHLLRREPIVLDAKEVAQHLNDRHVLVTGGGGSIGSELCLQIAAHGPERLVVLESNEYNLFHIEGELRAHFPRLHLYAVLGDVRHEQTVERVFRTHRPDIVFHAAAYKHVPLLETNPIQAVQTNVSGTRTLAETAHRHGASQFVLISTDKAVNPTNVMGTSKRVAELYCQNLSLRSDTQFITTRFGNVLGSLGSVVPLFEQQIAQGGPVTVTHPEIRRYFMTIPEAVNLILQAAAMGRGGEIFVLDMGEPVKIKDLAEQMIRLAGLTPHTDIPIVFTGLRPGEKLFEELLHEREELIGTSNPKLLLAAQRRLDWSWLEGELNTLREVVTRGDEDEVLASLQRIVPEFSPARFEPREKTELPPRPRLRVVE